MKTFRIAINLIGLVFLISCATVYDVKYDYDKQTDFTQFKTYNWMAVPENAGMDNLVVDRVKKAVNAELKVKGLGMTSENPDFLIAEHLGSEEKMSVQDWGYSYSPHGRYWGGYWGPRNVSTYEYEEGSLILDFVDAESKKLIWRGMAKAEVQNIDSPEKSEELVNKAVKEILKKFPPSLK